MASRLLMIAARPVPAACLILDPVDIPATFRRLSADFAVAASWGVVICTG